MAILTVCVNKQRKRKDGCYSVYIRVAHNGKSVYLPTDKVVSGKGLSSSMEVIDPFVLKPLSTQIVNWLDALNRQDISAWNARQVAEFLKNLNEDLVFSDYARKHIDRMIDRGQERNAKNYQLALQHMERYFGTTKVKFAQLTSINVNKWVATLSGTARAKEMYPICIRQIFRAAIDELNDYDNGIIRVKTNPWGKVKIPAADRPNKKAITAEACRAFFAAPLPESKMIDPLPELGRDVAMMSLCLAGMNTIDIFNLCKEDYHGGIIHYKRAKTTRTRTDDAYISPASMRLAKPQKKIKFSRACVCTRAYRRDIFPFIEIFYIFLFLLSKERFRKKCPFLPKFSEVIAINSERIRITSEEIAITSEVILINGEGILPEKWSKSAVFEE